MKISLNLNRVLLFSSILTVSFLSLSCSKDNENDINTPSNPPLDEGNNHLNPDLTYGNVLDQDGNTYATIMIGEQEWMAENLRTTTYCNGDTIPNVVDANEWVSLTTGAWSHYENDVQHGDIYGNLYNHFAVSDNRNICPCDWHVPTYAEWMELVSTLGGLYVAGAKMKSTGTKQESTGLWNSPNLGATNESGFSAIPSGSRIYAIGSFHNLENSGIWWSTTEYTDNPLDLVFWYFSLTHVNGQVYKSDNVQQTGKAVRCIRD